MNRTFTYEAPEAEKILSLSIYQAAAGESCIIGEQSEDPDACLDEIADENPF